MATFLVERYWPGVTGADVRDIDRRLADLGGPDAALVASTLMPTDEVVLFEFQATSAEAVLGLAERAGLRCDRLVAADRHEPNDSP